MVHFQDFLIGAEGARKKSTFCDRVARVTVAKFQLYCARWEGCWGCGPTPAKGRTKKKCPPCRISTTRSHPVTRTTSPQKKEQSKFWVLIPPLATEDQNEDADDSSSNLSFTDDDTPWHKKKQSMFFIEWKSRSSQTQETRRSGMHRIQVSKVPENQFAITLVSWSEQKNYWSRLEFRRHR